MLSRERITDAAITVLSRDGYSGLTMAALSRQLQTATSALYNHLNSKDEVIGWVQDRINQSIDTSVFTTYPWDEALILWARAYRAAFAQRSPLIPIIAVTPISGAPHTLRMYEQVAAGLQKAGWPEELLVDVIVAVESFILGSALDLAAPEWIFDAPGQEESAPVFTRSVAARPQQGAAAADAAFELGLAALVMGLREKLIGK